ncbi:MAG: phage tail tape measure C-terminal domain-containing protein [Litorimonas sp.]
MTETSIPSAGPAADAIAALDTDDAFRSADEIAEAFEAAGARIARSLENAAKSGELSFNSLADSVLTDLAKLAVGELIEAPLTAFVDGLTKSLGGSSGAATTVNMNISGASDPGGFRRSEGQIAATLARAVSLGQRRT